MLSSLLPDRALRRMVALAALVALFAAPVHAQSSGDGTIYSRFGVGELYSFSSSQVQGMGGGGAALRSLNYTGFTNPALWSDQVLTRASIGANLRNISATNASGASSQLSSGALQAIQFSFPLYTRKLGVGLAFKPFSRSNYRVVRRSETPIVFGSVPGDTSDYQINYEGRGGLQQIVGGLGYRINDALSVGASVDVIFGIIEEGRRTSFDNPNFVETNSTDATRLSGVTGSFGAVLTLADVFAGDDALSLGGSFTLPTTLSGTRVRTISEGLDRDTLGTGVDGSVDIPWRAQLGLTYKPDERWTIVMNGRYEPWSELSSTFDATGGPGSFPVGGSDVLTDRVRLSAGTEFLPAGTDMLESYTARMAYRLGAYYEKSYAQPVAGTNINVYAVTGGVSLPTMLSGTRVDLNLEIGTRGTTDQNLVRDLFYGLSLNINVGERWFRERKLR